LHETKILATINCPSLPLPFVLFPQGYHPVSLENSAGWTVRTLGGSIAAVMPLRLDTKRPEIINTKIYVLSFHVLHPENNSAYIFIS